MGNYAYWGTGYTYSCNNIGMVYGLRTARCSKSKLCLYDLACKSWAHFLSDFLSLVGGEGSIPSLPSISQHKFHFLIRYNYDKARS